MLFTFHIHELLSISPGSPEVWFPNSKLEVKGLWWGVRNCVINDNTATTVVLIQGWSLVFYNQNLACSLPGLTEHGIFHSSWRIQRPYSKSSNNAIFTVHFNNYYYLFYYLIITNYLQGVYSVLICLASAGIHIVEIRRSYNLLISTMRFHIQERHLYIESTSWLQNPHFRSIPQVCFTLQLHGPQSSKAVTCKSQSTNHIS